MRLDPHRLRVLVPAVALGMVLAGCLGPGREPEPGPPAFAPVDPALVGAPDATSIVGTSNGSVVVTWEGTIQGDRVFEVSAPPEAVAMRARYNVGGTGERGLSLVENQTGAPRCFSTQSLAIEDRQASRITCTGLTVLDTEQTHAAVYRVAIRGNYRQNSADVGPQTSGPAPFTVVLELLPGPLDGPVSRLDLSGLPGIRYERAAQFTDYVVSSSDAARLFVEVNLPEGEGPWPTILISSPYNQATRDAGGLTQGVRVRDWVPRGYAVVAADVRGFANSEGCVEVWGPKEQQDQFDLVEWVAQQPWSDGKVAMYGQSYVGTTPHEAAVRRPPHLVAIATVAGLTDPYFDWHFGGVPNSESAGSPVGYSLTTDQPPAFPESPEFAPEWVGLARTQGCDLAPLLVDANDPNAVYGEFYRVRNFTALAQGIQVPVLYTQGYVDQNVKVAQATRFFDAIPTTKIGVFGPWYHRHPPRGDFDVLLHAWMARWLKDAPTNVEAFPSQAITNVDTVRDVASWPPASPLEPWYLDGRTATLARSSPPTAWSGQFLTGSGALGAAPGVVAANTPPGVEPVGLDEPQRFRFSSSPLGDRLYIAGLPRFQFTAKIDGGDNFHVEARLYDVAPDGTRVEITFGMLNAGLRNGYERFEPMPRGEDVRLVVEMLATEFVVDSGHKVVLEIGQAAAAASATPAGQVTFYTGQSTPSRLDLPVLVAPMDRAAPLSVLGFEAFRTD